MSAHGGTEADPFLLEGVAVVTGASSGIGSHVTRLLARRGLTVVAAARRLERLHELANETAGIVPFRCDVASDAGLAQLVDAAARVGPLRVLVNNAGISDGPTTAIGQDPATFRRVIEVNLNALFVLSSMVAQSMVEAGVGGSIVNVASIHGLVASAPNCQAAYVASKAGVIGLTKELAAQWGRHGIRVNAIAPGYFQTELTSEMLATDSGKRYVERGALLRRVGELRELDGPVLLLASEAGSYITGETIAVDGGWTAR